MPNGSPKGHYLHLFFRDLVPGGCTTPELFDELARQCAGRGVVFAPQGLGEPFLDSRFVLVANVRRLFELRAELGSELPYVCLSAVQLPEVVPSMVEFEAMWQPCLGPRDEVFRAQAVTWAGARPMPGRRAATPEELRARPTCRMLWHGAPAAACARCTSRAAPARSRSAATVRTTCPDAVRAGSAEPATSCWNGGAARLQWRPWPRTRASRGAARR